MSPLLFNTYYRYAELTAFIQDFAARFPQLCRVTEIGKSYEGRAIWLLTLTNTDTGPDTDKPAFWVDANIHATEVAPSICALYAINKILNGYGTDPQITRLLDTRALYIVPRVNPDGAELYLQPEGHRRVRSSTRPYPFTEPRDGLHEHDIDGDQRILFMRLKDPNGAWKAHPDEPRLLIPRALDGSDSGPFYRLFTEGAIQNYDGLLIKEAPAVEGLDMNRNFPVEWVTNAEQPGAGPYPTSEPEVRALVQFIVDHPNITGAITFHTYSAVYLRPSSTRPDSDLPSQDLWTYQKLGEHVKRLTGYPAVPLYHDFKYHPKQAIKGVFDDWMYDHIGVYSWTCELWSPQRAAGIDLSKRPEGSSGSGSRYIDWYRDHPIEEDVQLLKWVDENTGGKGYVNWYTFQHPQLGEVELGGWDWELIWRNPPPHLLEKEIAPHADLIVWQSLISPQLEFREVTATALGEGVFRVRTVVQNSGWLPTYITAQAKDKKLARGLEFDLSLPEGATLMTGELKVEAGQLEGRSTKHTIFWNSDPTDDRAKAEWVVRAAPGSEVTITAYQPRAGRVKAVVKLQ